MSDPAIASSLPEQAGAAQRLSDESVVVRVREGDLALFEILMRRHNQRLFRAARSILREDAEAQDVVQHAWLQAYAHLDGFAGRSSFATWITRIAIHEALARARSRQRLRRLDDVFAGEDGMTAPETDQPDPERQALAGVLRLLRERAIDALPDGYRSVFVLREVQGMDTAEAAACLGVSEDVVKTRLSRARGMLRERLYRQAGLATAAAFPFLGQNCDRVVAAVLERLGPPASQRGAGRRDA
jgi:RNA polymerase sigma-70 factor (ECF subfamily)